MKYLLFLGLLGLSPNLMSQELPYYEIPEPPGEYTAEQVAARMIDGLAYRYYWATDSLRLEDLSYRPSEGARSSLETMEHIYDMALIILNATQGKDNTGLAPEEMDYSTLRRNTLETLKRASDNLKQGVKLEESDAVFKYGAQQTVYPFWNLINGPISDSIWHTGQIISFRRTSGNPYNNKASMFSGKVRVN